MKKTLKTMALTLAGCALAISATQCNNAQNQEAKPATPAKAEKTTANLPNYRYVDLDSVLSQYNLAKDYNEEMMRMQTTYESTVKQRESALNNFVGEMQKKMQNNQYLNEQAYNADQKKAAEMQNSAQSEIAKLQNNMAQSAADAQKIVRDSIKSFIETYNAQHHYDAIFVKDASLYINPDLDITKEVVEGLNARYNKVKK